MAQLLKINDTTVKRPNKFEISSYTLTKSTRTADGSMSMEWIANKRTFSLTYEVIGGVELEVLLGLLIPTSSATCFFTLQFEENGTTKTAVCYAGHIPREQHRSGSESGSAVGWVWKGVTFQLIEK